MFNQVQVSKLTEVLFKTAPASGYRIELKMRAHCAFLELHRAPKPLGLNSASLCKAVSCTDSDQAFDSVINDFIEKVKSIAVAV